MAERAHRYQVQVLPSGVDEFFAKDMHTNNGLVCFYDETGTFLRAYSLYGISCIIDLGEG